MRTSKTKAKKGVRSCILHNISCFVIFLNLQFSDQEDFAHHIDNPVYSTNKSDTASMKSDFET